MKQAIESPSLKKILILLFAGPILAATPATSQNSEKSSDPLLVRLGPALEKIEDRVLDFIGYLPLLFVAFIIVAIAFLLSKRVGRWDGLFERVSGNPFLRGLARQVVRTAVFVLGLLLALEVLNATALVGAVLGTAGVVGLAVGFAFRDLVENYIASVLLSLRQPFSPNDVVKIGSHQGKVIRLTSRATILMTFDGNHLRIPNADVFKGVILNFSRNPLRRFDFGVGVGFDTDLAEALRLGTVTLREMKGVVEDPASSSAIEELGSSHVQLRFYAWIDQREASLAKVKSEAIRLVKAAFENVEIEMPEPTYRILLEGGSGEILKGAAPPPKAERRRDTSVVQGDISVQDAVGRQVAAERAASDIGDLLDDTAPKE